MGRKKDTPWFQAAEELPSVAPAVPPKSKEASKLVRDARFALVQSFWPGQTGSGGRAECSQCRFSTPRTPWSVCRGKGGGTRNAHGPDVPDWLPVTYPIGTSVRYTLRSVEKVGVVTTYDAGSGFFTLHTAATNTSDDIFLGHASYSAQIGTREQFCWLTPLGCSGAAGAARHGAAQQRAASVTDNDFACVAHRAAAGGRCAAAARRERQRHGCAAEEAAQTRESQRYGPIAARLSKGATQRWLGGRAGARASTRS